MYTVSLQVLEEAAYRADFDPEWDAIRTDYSGRGMYGKTCIGLVHADTGELLKFAIQLFNLDIDACEWLPLAKQDDMGRSTITYWPGVQVEEVEVTS